MDDYTKKVIAKMDEETVNFVWAIDRAREVIRTLIAKRYLSPDEERLLAEKKEYVTRNMPLLKRKGISL